jgi:DNA helicase-2/ATP-dependent DNA helicase PcrA
MAMPSAIESRLLEDLNEEQRAAVLHEQGPLLILAGAGSGKTRVITRRLAHLILARGVDPMRLVAITFTNKAAREMKERVQQFVPRTDLWVSTFHSLAARILRREAASIGFKSDFTIYDTYDRAQAMRSVIRDLSLDEELYKPGQIAQQVSSRKNRGLMPGQPDPVLESIDPQFARIEKAYAERMKKNQALDFDDLLLKLLEVLEKHPDVAGRYANKFQYVLVDEYQDTNRLQYRITTALASQHQNLCVCGDPDQSIYAWRGADLRNILDFEKDFAPVHVVRLENNYRSKRNILDAAQALIEHNVGRKAKQLKTSAPPGEKIVILESIDELDEARNIVGWIRSLMTDRRLVRSDGDAIRLSDIAIFYRANFMQRAIEKALRDSGVPYRVASGLEFFERREIKDVLAYLRIVVNDRDDVAFARIVNVPARGVGAATLLELETQAKSQDLSLLEASRRRDIRALIHTKARRGVEGFLEIVDRIAAVADGPAEAAVEAAIEHSHYEQHCGALGDAGDTDRIENIRELVVAAREFDQRNPEGGLAGFLSEVALVSDTDKLDAKSDAVTLMTLHSAKGLEYPVVFIAGVEDGLIPHRRAVEERAGGEGLEEERRLFYVGITRAMERLFLSRARYRSQFGPQGVTFGQETAPSRFLDEIPDALLDDGSGGRRTLRAAEYGSSQGSEFDPVPDFDRDVRDAGLPEGGHQLVAGMRVSHAQFGEGRVVELRGSGVNRRAVVRFGSVGEKQLLLQYARLDPIP